MSPDLAISRRGSEAAPRTHRTPLSMSISHRALCGCAACRRTLGLRGAPGRVLQRALTLLLENPPCSACTRCAERLRRYFDEPSAREIPFTHVDDPRMHPARWDHSWRRTQAVCVSIAPRRRSWFAAHHVDFFDARNTHSRLHASNKGCPASSSFSLRDKTLMTNARCRGVAGTPCRFGCWSRQSWN